MADFAGRWTTVRVEVSEDIGWVILNRPEKRNVMNPTLNREMRDILETLELDESAKVLILTGEGDSWTAGMDLKEYFREVDQAPEILREKIRREAST
jgi:trans-feruloyl-CoA hydratase/vanillin synthase